MEIKSCDIDITLQIGEAGMGKIRMLRNPLWLVERLQILEGVKGVGFNPGSISLRINADLPTAKKTMDNAQHIINEELI